MDPVTIASLGLQGAKAIAGGVQALKGRKKLREAERPEYTMPTGVTEAENILTQQASEGMTSQAEQLATQGIDRSGASALKYGAGGNIDPMAVMGSQNNAYLNLAAQDEQIRQKNKRRLARFKSGTKARYQDKEFEYNQNQPYQNQVAEGQALIGSGLQNIFGGADAAAALLGNASQTENETTQEIDPRLTDPMRFGAPTKKASPVSTRTLTTKTDPITNVLDLVSKYGIM